MILADANKNATTFLNRAIPNASFEIQISAHAQCRCVKGAGLSPSERVHPGGPYAPPSKVLAIIKV